jgi:hypothetical protein
MHIIFALALGAFQYGSQASFAVQSELQGLYDEINQATLQFVTDIDVDDFHDVLYTPDWSFTNAAGQHRTWAQVREQEVQALKAAPADAIAQTIRKISINKDTATTTIDESVVRTVVDSDGKYGRKGASHTLTEVTAFRDSWVRVSDSWKLKSREQIGQPKTVVDKSLY